MFLCSISANQNHEKRKSPDISDALIEKIALGNTDALRELYEKTSTAVYGFALSILSDQHDAQDVMPGAVHKGIRERSAVCWQRQAYGMAFKNYPQSFAYEA